MGERTAAGAPASAAAAVAHRPLTLEPGARVADALRFLRDLAPTAVALTLYGLPTAIFAEMAARNQV